MNAAAENSGGMLPAGVDVCIVQGLLADYGFRRILTLAA